MGKAYYLLSVSLFAKLFVISSSLLASENENTSKKSLIKPGFFSSIGLKQIFFNKNIEVSSNKKQKNKYSYDYDSDSDEETVQSNFSRHGKKIFSSFIFSPLIFDLMKKSKNIEINKKLQKKQDANLCFDYEDDDEIKNLKKLIRQEKFELKTQKEIFEQQQKDILKECNKFINAYKAKSKKKSSKSDL